MNLKETRFAPEACVILSSGFANVGNFVFFASKEDAEVFAAENDGEVVDEGGLAEKYESMHCAEGRQLNQSASGRFVEYPSEEELENLGQTDGEWMEAYWQREYASQASEAWKNATVFEIESVDPTA